MIAQPQDVIQFWFHDHGPEDWFKGSAEFDKAIVDKFSQTHAPLTRANCSTGAPRQKTALLKSSCLISSPGKYTAKMLAPLRATPLR